MKLTGVIVQEFRFGIERTHEEPCFDLIVINVLEERRKRISISLTSSGLLIMSIRGFSPFSKYTCVCITNSLLILLFLHYVE